MLPFKSVLNRQVGLPISILEKKGIKIIGMKLEKNESNEPIIKILCASPYRIREAI